MSIRIIIPAMGVLVLSGCAAVAGARAPAPSAHRSARIAPPMVAEDRTEMFEREQATTPNVLRTDRATSSDRPVASLGSPAARYDDRSGAPLRESPGLSSSAVMEPNSEQPGLLQPIDPKLEGPVLPGMGTIRNSARVELIVEAPRTAAAGTPVTFQLTVQNRTEETLENVVVESEFDSSLKFPGSDQKRARQVLGTMRPGENRSIALTLIPEGPGDHCCRFAVSSRGSEAVWKSVCLDAVRKEVETRLIGPSRRPMGSQAEFTAKIVNTSSERWQDVRATITHPAALVPRDASAGAKRTKGALEWAFGSLEPGEGVQLQVEYECVQPGSQVCVQLRVAGGTKPEATSQACLEIVPAASSLRLQVSDGADPLSIGEETEYLVSVRNESGQPLPPLELIAEFPEILSVISADVTSSLSAGKKPEARLETNRVALMIPLIPTKGEVQIRIRAKGERAGDGTFKVRVLARNGELIDEMDEMTTVNR